MKEILSAQRITAVYFVSIFICGRLAINHEFLEFETASFPCTDSLETLNCSSVNGSDSNYTMEDRPSTTPYYPEFNIPDFSIPSPEDIEMYLERLDTQEYLNSFSNSFQRYIIQETLRYCPYTKLCNFSFGLEPSPFVAKTMCCSDCECNAGCEIDGNCCPDYKTLHLPMVEDVVSEDTVETCMLTDIRYQPDNATVQSDHSLDSDYILTYQACPLNVHESLRFRCEGEFQVFQNLTVDDVIPLSDNVTMKTYRNKHCAICNGADLDRLTPWSVGLSCNDRPVFSSIGQLVSMIMNGRVDCELNLKLPTSVDVQYCDDVISDCNTTGLWDNFDPDVYRACKPYEATVRVEKGLMTYHFRNPFCAVCNGMKPTNYYCHPYSVQAGQPFSFSGLLRLETLADKETTRDVRCGSSSMFDSLTVSELNNLDFHSLKILNFILVVL